MGKKYRRYRNALEKYFASDSGRRFFHIAYSLGAAVVVLGALFKINRYPFGSEMMLIGLGAEALIFALSAFDRPVREYPWEEVFPEFASAEQLEQKKYFEQRKREKEVVAETGVVDPPVLLETQTVPQSVTPPSQNLDTYGGYRGGVVSPAEPHDQKPAELSAVAPQQPSPVSLTPDMAAASDNYVSQVNRMSENVEKFNELTQSLNQLSDVLVSSFKHITDNSEGIGSSTKGYVAQMESLNRNISGLNTIYEIQLKGVSSQINAIDQINSGLDRIKNMYEGAIPDSSVFRAETEKLAQQLKDLNMVYARMLQAMTVNMAMGGANVPPNNHLASNE